MSCRRESPGQTRPPQVPRFLLLSLLATMAACCLAPFSLHAAAPTEIRVMSFNIWVSGGKSLTQCAEAIRKANADIVGLQECNPDAAATLAGSLGFFRTTHSGIPILSRYPITTTLQVPGGSGATIQINPRQKIHFFNCHLTAYPYGPYSLKEGRSRIDILREEQQTRMPALTNLLQAMQPFIASTTPCFLTGDFNAPSHLDYADFPWPTSLACTQSGLVDVYRTLHPQNRTFPNSFRFDDPGITWTPLIETEPNGVFDRIDFIYVSDHDGVQLLESEALDERNNVKPWPSDHRAVLARVQLPGSEPQKNVSSPAPVDLSIIDLPQVQVSWVPALEQSAQRIHFGQNEPLPLLAETTNDSWTLPRLRPGSTYRWRVDSLTPQGWIEGPLWSFSIRPLAHAIWNFESPSFQTTTGSGSLTFPDGNVTSNLLTWARTDGVGVPHIQGQPAGYLKIPKLTQPKNGLWITLPTSKPNGGGQYINQYTLIWDLFIPAPLSRMALFNTQPNNGNDADLYVLANGRIGSQSLGYSAVGTIRSNQWTRLIFTADLAAGWARVAVDGTPVLQSASNLDGTYSLYSSLDEGADLLLFNEGDTSGTYTHEVALRQWAWLDRSLSPAEIREWGAIGWATITPATDRPILQWNLQAQALHLSWQGGSAPFRVQHSSSLLQPNWRNVSEPLFTPNSIIPKQELTPDLPHFFRVVEE